MKYEDQLKQDLIRLGDIFGNTTYGINYANPTELKNSSLIFNEVSFSFQKDSWASLSKNNEYFSRTQKIHPNVQTKEAGILEMQSSNSSDALAMNIFCHPDFTKWEGTKNLFQVDQFAPFNFGFKAKIQKTINDLASDDDTEVDIFFNNIIAECKLTESDFTSKVKEVVNQYSEFENTFYIDKLSQNTTHFHNYQLIRNILAAKQYQSRFILICDMRRPDLTKSFLQTVACVKDVELRTNCEVIFWQDIAKVVGRDLKLFLKEKYGIE